MLVVWLVLGVALLLAEMHHMAFFAMFGAAGAFAAAMVAGVAPDAIPLQAAVAAGVSIAGVVAVRPYVSRAFDARRGNAAVRGVHGGIVGHEAVTIDEVGGAHRTGHVRQSGERWLAVSASGTTIPADTVVVVTAVRGTTLVVLPVDSLSEKTGEQP